MPSETSTAVKGSSTSKSNESRLLAIANLPETATEETVKEYFQRYGRVLSVKINEQRFAFVGFTDVRAASKAHNAENLLDDQLLRTAFHDGSASVPKTLLEPATVTPTNTTLSSTETTSLINSVTVESITNPSQSTAMTNNLSSKTMNGDREKRSSRTHGSPDDNVRHQVVPVKRDSDSSGSKRKATSTNLSKNSNSSHPTVQKPSHRKHEKSSSTSSSSSLSESEQSSDDSLSCKNRRRHAPKTHSTLNDSMRKTRVLKLYHLPAKMPRETLRGSIWDLLVDFKKTGRLLTVKIEGENESRFALLTFTKSEDVERALNFVTSKSIGGTRLKAEPFDASTPETEDHEPVKRSIRTDQDTDEYSAKATRTLYIGNLQSEISYNDLRETYSAYGDIIEVEIKRQTQLQHQLPFAFVQYADIKSVVKAMKAFEPKLARDHSIKLGFGKSQPTNVLWLDDLPATINESALRNAINRLTNLSNEQVLDIYIDDRNSHKSQTAQCLIYFIDTRAAQEAINSIRGKKIEGKRIQVDFASKVFVTRFSDIIEEASHTKIYAGYSADETYHNEPRTLIKRNGTAREIVSDPLPPFDAASARSNPTDRWSNLYNSNRMSHKTESRHPSDRRYSKEYSKGTNNSLISIPSIDNGGLVGSSATRRHRVSTSSKDSLSNNFSSGRSAKRTARSRRNASSTSSSSSRSTSTSSQSSSSSNSVERRSNSHAKHSTSKSARKSSSKPSKSATASATNNKPIKKKSSSNKEVSAKSSHRSRTGKSEKDDEPTASNAANGTSQPTAADPMILPTLTGDDQSETNRKESSSPAKPSITIHSSSSPKAPLKNTERVFDWLMQNHHQESNGSIGLDVNDDDESNSKRKTDEDSLENVSDDPTAKTPPPSQRNNSVSSTNRTLNNLSSSNARLSKNDKSALSSSYRLQPIRVGTKRDDQQGEISNNETSQHGSSPPPATTTTATTTTTTATVTEVAAIPTPTSAPPLSVPSTPLTPSIVTAQQQPMTPITPTPLSASSSSLPVHKDENEAQTAMRRPVKPKNSLSTGQMKIIPLDSQSSYDQLDVRLKSYPSLFNDHTEAIRLPFPQFAFEYLKNSSASATVLVVLNPKAHLKHSSLGLNNPSTSTSTTTSTSTLTSTPSKIEPLIDTVTTLPTLTMNNDDDLSTARIPLDERIRLLDKQMNEMNQGQQKSTASSSSSTSSASLSPATLLDQQTQKNTSLMTNSSVTSVKNVNDLVSPLLSASSSATLNQCLQAARAAINAQPASKTPLTLPSTNPFSFPVGSVSPLNPTRTLPVPTPPSVTIPPVLMAPTPLPPPPPPPPPFPTLRRLSDSTSNSILNDIQAALAQTQMVAAAAAAKYTSLTFPTTLHPPPPPIPASLISPSLSLNSPTTPTTTNPLVPTLTCPPPPPPPPAPTVLTTPTTISSPTLPNRSNVTDLLSPTISNLPSHSSLSDVNSQSPSTSSAKIIERLGPSAKVKRKPIPPPLVVATSSNSLTTTKDSSVLPSPDANSSTTGNSNAHHSPVTSSSSPTLQHQTSNSSTTGLKSILKQRSLSNSSSVSPTHERQSPTGERKLSTSYVSPLASNESRSTSNAAPTKNRSASIDSTSTTTTTAAAATTTMKRTPPSTPTNTKKNPINSSQDNHVLSSDVDDRQDEKKSTWRTPPSKQTESTITKKPILDKIPKKNTVTTAATTPKPAVTAPTVTAASTPKAVKPAKPNPTTPVVSKTPQLNLDRVDTKGIKTSHNESSTKATAKPTKLKRTNFIHSDSDTEKKTSSNNNEQKTKKPLGNNELVKRKQQQQQQQQQQKSTPVKKSLVGKAKTKTNSNVKKQSTNEILSSASEIDERKADTTSTHSEQDQESSDDEDKTSRGLTKKSSKITKKTSDKRRKNALSSKDLRLSSSMYDRIKKRQRNEQNRQSSVSTSEDHLSDENTDDDDDDKSDRDDDDDDDKDDEDDDVEEEEDYQRKSHRSNHVGSKSHAKKLISDTSDSEDERLSRKKTKNTTVFDINIFDDGDSDEKNSKAPPPKKKIEPPAKPVTKKPMVKSNNESTKKEMTAPAKTNIDTSTTKKKVMVTKPTEKKKNVITTSKPISKIIKSTNAAQKRPSTDDPNEITKKMKTNDEKSKVVSKEETIVAATAPTVTRAEATEVVPAEKPAIVITSPNKTNESSTTPVVEAGTPNTPSKFGIVFTSQRRQSTASASSTSVPPSTSHEESKNEIEDMDDDTETHPISNTNVSKDESVHAISNTLKPPMALASGLSDDETLNPETMQLSDLIGASRREEPKPTPTRPTAKTTTTKGKRGAKPDVTPNKRQQVKNNAKNVRTITSEEKEVEATVVKPIEPTISVAPMESTPAPLLTNSKRLSTTESSSIASPATEKPEAKRLRPSIDEPIVTVKTELVQNVPEAPSPIQIKEEVVEPVLVAPAPVVPVPTPVVEPKEVVIPPVSEPTSQVTSMETEALPPASSIITTNQSSPSTSHETETAIKAVYSSIQIPTPTISKLPTLDKTTPIIAPISKETLPIVEHQTTPITTTSILPTHVSIKSTLPSTTFNENVEETLSAVNSLLMLNNNPPNPSSDHPALKGTARVTPTISKPVYSVVASFPTPTTSASAPAPTAPSRPTTISSAPTGGSTTTATTQSAHLMTLVSNIVSSSNLNGDKQSPTIATAAPIAVPSTSSTPRSHIEEVIDDVAKGGSATTPVVAAAPIRVATPVSTVATPSISTTTTATSTTTTTAATIVPEPITSLSDTNVASSAHTSTKATSIPPILRDVMKTPCLTSTTTSTTITAPSTTTTVTSETLNLFDPHRHATPTSKTATNTATHTTNVSTTVTSSTPVVPVVVRPNVSKTPTSHKRSSTPKTEQPTSIPSAMLHTFPTLMSSDGSFFAAAAAHHPNFPFTLFNPISSNSSNPSVNTPSNLLPPSLLSNSPPLPVRTSSANNPNASTTSHMMTNPLVNTILPGQQSGISGNAMHSHEKPKRDVSSKSSVPSSSSSNRSTPIQQAVPVPIPLNIPPSSNTTSANLSSSQQQQQQSSLLNSLDPAAAAALRQQSSPMQPFLGSDPGVPFRNVFSDAAELYGTAPGLYPPPNIAYAAQQMLNAMAIGGSHHPSAAAAALAELYTNPDPFYRMGSTSNELSRDPYNVQWQGNLILKNDQAYVKTQLVAGSPQIARASMNYWNSDSPCSNSSNLQTPSHHNLRISQRMRLEQAQLEGVQKRMQMDSDHCILIAEPNGSTPDEIRIQQNNLKNGVIRYFDEKKAAGIVNVLLPGTSQPAYVVHIFPPCQFASEILQRRAPDTYRCVVQNKIEQIYLLIVITSTVQ